VPFFADAGAPLRPLESQDGASLNTCTKTTKSAGETPSRQQRGGDDDLEDWDGLIRADLLGFDHNKGLY
jgi:hypothetical protein